MILFIIYLLQIFVAFTASLIVSVVIYFKWSYTYWKRKNVPYIEPKFPFGTTDNPWSTKTYVGTRIKKQYDIFKSQGHKHGGLYSLNRPTYLPVDLEYIKNIMSKDFQYFTDHGLYYNEKDDPLSANLLQIEGQRWRNLRPKLTPAFTPGKIKIMFQSFLICSKQLVAAVDEYQKRNEPIDTKEIMGCFTTDIIGCTAFGIDCNSFQDADNDFRKYGKQIFGTPTRFQAMKNAIAIANHKLGRRLHISISTAEVRKYFMKTIKDTIKCREENGISRRDFLQILVDMKNQDENNSLTIDEVAAQVFVFFLAGYETSSTVMTFCLFELALNISIQERLREEIMRMFEKFGNEITYEAIMELKYMNQVIDETLRKYPPIPIIPRKCVENYKVPDTNVIIEKNTMVLIPAFALHYDPSYFPDPEKFDPERFNEERKAEMTPFSYIPFGEGPRICIGARFGTIQAKLGLIMLLKNFKFAINRKTKLPLVIDPSVLILTLKEAIWLDVKKISI